MVLLLSGPNKQDLVQGVTCFHLILSTTSNKHNDYSNNVYYKFNHVVKYYDIVDLHITIRNLREIVTSAPVNPTWLLWFIILNLVFIFTFFLNMGSEDEYVDNQYFIFAV